MSLPHIHNYTRLRIVGAAVEGWPAELPALCRVEDVADVTGERAETGVLYVRKGMSAAITYLSERQFDCPEVALEHLATGRTHTPSAAYLALILDALAGDIRAGRVTVSALTFAFSAHVTALASLLEALAVARRGAHDGARTSAATGAPR